MPIVVGCPSCSSQLRVADNLLGRQVRCPACQTVFEAAEAAREQPAGESNRPQPREQSTNPPAAAVPPAPYLGPLRLSLDDDEPAGPQERVARPDPNAPRGRAVRVSDEDEPPRQASSPREDRREGLRECPECGARVDRDETRCPRCKASLKRVRRFEDEDIPRRAIPDRWEDDDRDDEDYRPPVRRDCEPHRGGLVLTFGIIGVVGSGLGFIPCFGQLLLVPTFVLGLIAWIMGGGDLRKMRQGTMDPAGMGSTQAGWICGIIGTCLSTLIFLLCLGYFGLVFSLSSTNTSNPPGGPRFAPANQRRF
jgi:predicted Zn finger-like uncharacterized protein